MNSDTQNALEEVEQMGFPKNRNKIILRIIRKFSLGLAHIQGSETQYNTTEYIPNVFQVSLTQKMRKVIENLP